MKNEKEEFANMLIQNALSNNHREAELIQNQIQARAVFAMWSATKTVIEMFDKSERRTMKKYSKSIAIDQADPQLLGIYKTFQTCRKFYEAELAVLDHMLDEFMEYRKSHSFAERLAILLAGKERESWEQYDFLDIKERHAEFD